MAKKLKPRLTQAETNVLCSALILSQMYKLVGFHNISEPEQELVKFVDAMIIERMAKPQLEFKLGDDWRSVPTSSSSVAA